MGVLWALRSSSPRFHPCAVVHRGRFSQAYGIGLCLPNAWAHATALLTVLAPALSPEQLAALNCFDACLATYSTPAGSDDEVAGGSGEGIQASAQSLSENMEAVRTIGSSRIKPVKSTK
jgi:hypothetical protein